MNNPSRSKLDELQKKLYEKDSGLGIAPRRVIHEKDFQVPEDWNKESVMETVPQETASRGRSNLPLFFLLCSVLVFLSAALFAWISIRDTSPDFSSNFITLSSETPAFVDGGDPFDHVVQVANQNPQGMELVSIQILYPQGVAPTEAPTVFERKLNDVPAGGLVRERFPITLYGVPGTTKEITTILKYSVPGSPTVFEKRMGDTVEIKTAPIVVSLDTVKSITSGQTMQVKARVESTRGKTVPNTRLTMYYPSGFEFVSADVTPTQHQSAQNMSIWDLGTLTPGVTKEITITGIARGENGERRALRAEVGTTQDQIASTPVLIADTIFEYEISRPFLSTLIRVNRTQASTYNIASDSQVSVSIEYVNTTNRRLQNAEVYLYLRGNAVDKESVRVQGGYYDSRTDRVVWTRSGVSALANIEPGASGSLSVSFETKPPALLQGNEEIILETGAQARRIGETQVVESVEASHRTVLRVGTRVALSAESARSGSFAVFGPIPPRANQETSYVLDVRVQSSVNPIENAQVTFRLPNGVRYVESLPSQGTVLYSEFDREVRWNVGTVVRSASAQAPVLQVHVVATPSLSEVGTSLTLATDFTLRAVDTFTKTSIRISGPENISSRFRARDGYVRGNEFVQPE